MTNQTVINKINKSLKTIETNFENYLKLQEKNLLSIKSEINLINTLLMEIEEPGSSSTSKKKPTSSNKTSDINYSQLFQTIINERTSPNFSDDDNSLHKFIKNNSLAIIQEFCTINGIILKVTSPKNKLYHKIISALTEKKRF